MRFLIKTPWDYHKQAEVVIEASSDKEAIAKLEDWIEKADGMDKYLAKDIAEYRPFEATPIVDDIYFNSGCDC